MEAIAVNRMSCNISDYCANKMTLKMTITAPVIITNPEVVTEKERYVLIADIVHQLKLK